MQCSRWVSVVEFHDPTLIIGKVFGQESTVVKWNYQILRLHPVAVRQKLGLILVIKWFKNWSQQKNAFYKKSAPKLICFNEFFFRKIRMIFDLQNSLWKSKIGTFLTNCHQMETQNLVISFDYSWFLAKNLAYAKCRIMKFHYRNSSISQEHYFSLFLCSKSPRVLLKIFFSF